MAVPLSPHDLELQALIDHHIRIAQQAFRNFDAGDVEEAVVFKIGCLHARFGQAITGRKIAFIQICIRLSIIDHLSRPKALRRAIIDQADIEAVLSRRSAHKRRDDQTADLVAEANGQLMKLPSRERTAVSLHYLEEMTIREVAMAMGIPFSTCDRIIQRGLQRLRELMSD